MNINITMDDIRNFISGVEYLKEHLEGIDVSGDFAPDPQTSVSAWELLTHSTAYKALTEAVK